MVCRVQAFFIRVVVTVACLLCITSASAQQAPSDIPQIPFEKYTLKNGLEVILVEDKRLPLVAVNIWYHVGAANEEPGLTGFAHLFEHMMFAATKHVPRGMADRLLEGAGGSDSNGTTNNDRTNYFDTVPSHQLELALWIHADRMGFLLDVLDQTALANQQDVVRNERRQNFENRPYGLVQEALNHNLYPKEHPYYAGVIGSHADIQNAKLEDIKRFFKKYYRPNNATLAIVGDIDKAGTKALIEKYFGSFARGEDVPRAQVKVPTITAQKRVVVPDKVELPRVIIGWHTPKAYAPGDTELRLLGDVLASGKSSRLYKSLVYEQQIAQEVNAYQDSQGMSSVFAIDVTAAPGKTAEQIEKAIDAELDKLFASSVTQEELDRARNLLETGVVSGLEKFGGFTGVANVLNQYNHFTGDPGYLAKDIAALRALTPDAVLAAAKQYLTKDARVIIHGVPGEKNLPPEPPAPKVEAKPGEGTESLNAAEPWRAAQPKPASAKPLALPKPDSFKLANGLTVVHYRQSALPLAAAALVLRDGGNANPPDRPGLANFAVDMLDEGTQKRSAEKIADDLALLGATLSATANAENILVSTFALKRNFGKALDIMAESVLQPAFAENEVERVRKRLLGDISVARVNPTYVAAVAAAGAMFGSRHPMGYSGTGTEASVKAITRDELRRFWSAMATPDHAALILVGDLSRDEAKRLAESRFGAWKGKRKAQVAKAARERSKAQAVIVDIAGAPQTAFRITSDAPSARAPDQPALSVMNAAFGGLFTSRLNDNLREVKGYTYGAYSAMSLGRDRGDFTLRTSVRTDATGPAIQEVMNEMKGMLAKPVVGAELNKARDSQLRSLPAQFETIGTSALSFAQAYANGLGLDYYARLPGKLERVGAADVKAAAQRFMQPERFIFSAAGDRSKIEPELKKAGLTRIEYRNADGLLIPAK